MIISLIILLLLLCAQYFNKASELNLKHSFTQELDKKLIKAVREGKESLVISLLELGANVNAKDAYEKTALTIAAIRADEFILNSLISAGAIESRDFMGTTTLMWACRFGHENIVKALIKAGSNVNAKNNYGNSGLTSAAKHMHERIVQILLEAGAQPKLDKDGNLLYKNHRVRKIIEKKYLEYLENIKCAQKTWETLEQMEFPKDLIAIITGYISPKFSSPVMKKILKKSEKVSKSKCIVQ